MASICFVSLKNLGALTRDRSLQHIGGAEMQQFYLAQGLRDRGHRVSFITFDHGQADGIEIDGIRVYKAYRPEAGIRGIRFFHPRWTRLYRAMRYADADVYYQRTAAAETGQVAAWCRRYGRRFIFGVASDANCDPALPGLSGWRERKLYRYGLRHADVVIAQTRAQQAALRQAFGCESVLIRSCCRPVTAGAAGAGLRAAHAATAEAIEGLLQRPRVLWVGRFNPLKRLEWCLDLAEACPGIGFDVVGSSSEPCAYVNGLLARAARLPNVVLHGALLPDEVDALYDCSAVLLCTSRHEGFPNTFLEAWSHGRPVVSTVDPDGVIAQYRLGVVAAEPRELAERLKGLLTDASQYRAMASECLSYVHREHRPERILDAYEQVIRTLVGSPDRKC